MPSPQAALVLELEVENPQSQSQSHPSLRVTRATNPPPLDHFRTLRPCPSPFYAFQCHREGIRVLLCFVWSNLRNPQLHSLWSAPALAISLVIKARPFSLRLLEGRPIREIDQPAAPPPPKKRTNNRPSFLQQTRSPSPSRPSIRGDAVFSVIIGVCKTRSADRETARKHWIKDSTNLRHA
jgi:hypothetical protein